VEDGAAAGEAELLHEVDLALVRLSFARMDALRQELAGGRAEGGEASASGSTLAAAPR
jgi:hypothetical protein